MYSLEEQETSAVFDPISGKWNVYSCCRKHITKLLKVAGIPYWSEVEPGSNGEARLIAAKWLLSEKQLKFAGERAPLNLSEEERAARRERLARSRTQP